MKTKKASKEIVRAWFDTILNPIYDGLFEVKIKLDRTDYNWYWVYKDFFEIKSMGEFYNYRYYPNYEQIAFIEFPELITLSCDYDQKRSEFNKACNNLYNKLVASQELKALQIKIVNEYAEKELIKENEVSYMLNDESINWIAGYLINQKTNLDYSNIYHLIWKNEFNKFYDIIKSENLSPSFEDMKKSLLEFQQKTNDILITIKNKNMEISQKYGVPIVIQ